MQEEQLLVLILREILDEFSSTIGKRAAYGIAARAAARVLNEERRALDSRLSKLLPEALLDCIRSDIDRT